MSKKPGEKKNPSIARPIRTTTSQGDDFVFTQYRPSKKIKPNLSVKDPFKGYFHYQSHASWRTEIQATIYGRGTAQQFIDTRNILFSVPAFREEIIQIRNQRSLYKASLNQIAAQVCSTWKIPNGKQWIAWLIKHWDPATAQRPPIVSLIPPDSFPPWTIDLHYLQEATAGPEVCRSATITLNAGVSGREAQRITALAYKALDPSKRKVGRPRFSDLDIEILRSEFVRLGIPQPQRRRAMSHKVQKACIQSYNCRFSITFIEKELRRWLREQNQTVRRYVTESSSASPKPS